MSVTIADIAKEAGVSIATVSRVVNGTKPVSPEVRARVCKVIEQYHYKPNALARGLITRKTQMIGIVIPDISNPVFGAMVSGVSSVCDTHGYTVIISQSQKRREQELQVLDVLEDKGIDGVLFAGVEVSGELTDTMAAKAYPVVLVMQEAREPGRLDTVIHDNWQAGQDAAEFLIQNGHRRIALISGPDYDFSSGEKRTGGFMAGLAYHDLQLPASCVEAGDFSFASGFRAMKKIYEENAILPTAVMAGNDHMAAGAIQFLAGVGMKVPDDISVMGFDDLELASYIVPELATVRVPYFEEGVRAAELLISRMDERHEQENQPEPQFVQVPHKIIRRKSVASI